MPEEQSLYCPFCGKNVPPGADKCPSCSTPIDRVILKRNLDRVIERRIMRKLKSSPSPKVTEAPPIPEAPLPDVKVTCPGCGLELSGGETKCSRCGVPLAGEEDLLQCPDCGSAFAPGAKKCPKCGVVFAEAADELLPPPPEAEEPELAPRAEVREVLLPEVVTPMPVETMPMGRGLTNGRGAINGTGLVNGTGMINGSKAEGRSASTARRRGVSVARWQFLAILIALVIIIPTFIYISYSKESSAFAVDGDFGEWDDMDSYTMSVLTTTPITVVEEWSVAVDDTRVYFYVSAVGDIFGTTSVESLFLFVDADGDPDTGYAIGTMGAEFMVELDGWNDSVQSSDVSEYAPDEAYDWNAWESIGGAASRLEGSQLEAMANIQEALSSDARFMLLSQDQMARRSVSSSVPVEGGALIVTQRLSSSVPLSGIVPSSASAPLLTLTFTCDGAGGSVDSVEIELENLPALTVDILPFTLQPGDVETVNVAVDTSALESGQFVSASVSESGIGSSFAGVVVVGHPARAYVGSAPSSVHIDGAFGDWYGRTASDIDLVDVTNANIDIREVGVSNTTLSSSFFVSVDGEMCSGSYVPFLRSKPVPGDGGTVVPATRKTAEDITRIFIDSDMSSATGMVVSADSKVIGADYRIEVRGLNGMVVSSVLSRYTGTTWATVSNGLDVEVDSQRMEVSVLSYNLDGAVAIDFVIETTDWRQSKDYVSMDEATMLALTSGLSSSVGTLAWAVDSSATSANATASSFQRKLFYDDAIFWSFYFDGSNTVWRYSINGGATWSSGGRVFTTDDVRNVCIWYDSNVNRVYVIGDNSSTSEFVYVRSGAVSTGTPSITWGSEYELDMSTTNFPLANKNCYITKDVNGQVWVAVVTRTHATLQQYNIRTASTTTGDDVGAWTDRGNLINPRMDNPYGSATLVPGTSATGIFVWAIYTFQGEVHSRTFSSSGWSTERDIYLGGLSQDNTRYAPPSAVMDSAGVVHVVYGTGDVSGVWKATITYIYSTSTSTWSAPFALSAVASDRNTCPTISLDSATGNLYAMWIAEGGGTYDIEVRKSTAGTWSDLTVTRTSNVKTHLTSIYSVAGEAYICWQWTEGTTPPYTVMFDKIPEFSDVVVPVLFMLTIFIVISRRRSRNEEPPRG